MDEPLANLDQARRNDILPYLDRLCVEAGIPILYVSHSIEEVARLSNTLVILSDGQTPAYGPVADMLARTDLGKATGRHEAGALLEGTVARVDPEWGLTDVDIGGAILQIPDMAAEVGDAVRLRIRARDVALALYPPEGLSIRNAFEATISSISSETGPYAEILCSVGRARPCGPASPGPRSPISIFTRAKRCHRADQERGHRPAAADASCRARAPEVSL